MKRRRIVPLLAVCAWVVLGCGTNEERQGREAAQPLLGSPLEAIRPGPGRVVVEFNDGRVTLYSNRAPRRLVLEELARAARFEFALGVAAELPLTLSLVDIELSSALPLVVGELRYWTDWDFEPLRGNHRLRRLEVGSRRPIDGVHPATSLPAPATDAPGSDIPAGRASAGTDPVEKPGGVRALIAALARTDLAEHVAQTQREREELLERLEDRDAELRASAVAELETEGEDLERLLILVRDDPAPEVRLAAVSQLSDAESHDAAAALTAALDDPNREVVLEAIDALAFADDPSTIPALEPLLSHPDAAIRSAAEEALDFLEF